MRFKQVVFLLFFHSFLLLPLASKAQFSGNQTPTYPQLIHFYDSLAKLGKVELYNMGASDYGLPIYLCVLNGEKDSLKTFEKARKGTSIFINNGIHPGEPDGVNACGKLTLDYLNRKLKFSPHTVLGFVLYYNVGGAMTRSSSSRANQDGPEEYGFRGNAQNLDLNRDFIKMDSENAFTFAKIYHALDPDVFVDTHVSNGADYQYTLTLIHSMKERLQPAMAHLTYQRMAPDLEKKMKKHKIDLFPYVELLDETPDSGLQAFNDLPRYAMGYASLFHSLSITTETHMLKPFEQRVEATYLYLLELILWTQENGKDIDKVRLEAQLSASKQSHFTYTYQLTKEKDSISFLGFEHGSKKSEVTGLDRLYYDRTKPYKRYIPHYKHYQALDSAKIPRYYVVGAQCKDVLLRLKQNHVEFEVIGGDSSIEVTINRVLDYKNGTKPYEGHFVHNSINTLEEKALIHLKKGDVLIPTNQKARMFICSVLEPEAEDSYFAWNFFDSYLQEKEYFSSYVFEDLAVKILAESPEIRARFEEAKKNNPKMLESQWEQLYFIYKASHYFEPSFMRLPVFKVF